MIFVVVKVVVKCEYLGERCDIVFVSIQDVACGENPVAVGTECCLQ